MTLTNSLRLCKSSFIIGSFLIGILLNAVPLTFQYQGHIIVDGVAFEGTGSFKFALIDETGATLWSHDATSADGGEPSSSITLEMERGVYIVELGDTEITNMSEIPASVFGTDTLFLRVWFDDGVNGSQQLEPDTPISSVAFSMRAAYADVAATTESIPDGLIQNEHFSEDLLADIKTLRSIVDNIVVFSSDAEDNTLTGAGFSYFHTLTESSWEEGATDGQPSRRFNHGSVWLDDAWMIWGGMTTGFKPLQTGGIYSPSADAWTSISLLDAPSARWGHSQAWTGETVLVWGGMSEGGLVGDGSRYDPTTQFWRTMSDLNAPAARAMHASVWTGDGLVVWSGRGSGGWLEDGAVYDPAVDAWTSFDLSSLPLTSGATDISAPSPRYAATSVWTGSALMVFGGQLGGDKTHTGFMIQLENGQPVSWEPMSEADAPGGRTGHTAIWTGNYMIVWGGSAGGSPLEDGAAYDPATDTWTPLSSENAPGNRQDHTAVWTGEEMLIIGGVNGADDLADGYAYSPTGDTWRTLSDSGDPLARSEAAAVWTGDKVMIFGGRTSRTPVSHLQSLNPEPALYLFRKQ
jgi:hypothetical protein